MTPASWVDHLVIAADSLEQGVAWCEETLGVTPGPGGVHPLMGTHNRLLSLACEAYPTAYLEIIAIDPAAAAPGRTRWFDLDDPALRAAIRTKPRLVHFVAATDDAASAVKSLERLGIDRGPLVAAERPTPAGLLRWQISVRDDGQRLFYGALPTLIEWGSTHPTSNMPPSGLALQSLQVSHPRAEGLRAAHEAIGLKGVKVTEGPPDLIATFTTPKGTVTIESAAA
ncbi:VOC family protein [Caenimonas aquaedulcis]|uniref:VOC family protein n=1 Tax=Caenimonas aquaedulcis TaxID=2793270 RepID=A0A931H4Z9_9BURK|nr:VOC family protein [Caenimonas aquaedulcis]MBG9388530.1 VOC family protein [Caenimonas aquaedulcis]